MRSGAGREQTRTAERRQEDKISKSTWLATDVERAATPPTLVMKDQPKRRGAKSAARSNRHAKSSVPRATAWHNSPMFAGGALVAIALIAYLPALQAGFVWDDETNVTNNTTLRSLDGLRQMWFEPRSLQQYYPLMYTSYWLEYQLWGLAPLGYHLTNILWHAAAAILVWRLLARLRVPGAWLAAAIFAVHPVEVESVAWVTERKNVLSLSLAILSMLCYLRFSPPEEEQTVTPPPSAESWRWYALALALFALALFAKTVVVTMPAVLLVVYWWKRGRIAWQDVARLVPFLALSVGFGLLTRWLELKHVGAEGEQWSLTVVERLLLAGRALWFYAGKLLWPHPLVLFYPRWTLDAQAWWQFLFPAAALLLPAVLWLARKQIGRGPLAAVLIFAGVLVPALGFFNVYFTQYAQVSDHFQYHASVALIALATAGAMLVFSRLTSRARNFAQAGTGALLIILAAVTWRQSLIYHDLETLYRDTIAKNATAWMAYSNLAVLLIAEGRCEEAIPLAREALRIDDSRPREHYNYATAILDAGLQRGFQPGELADAIAHFRTALRLDPDSALDYVGLGKALAKADRPDEALESLNRALQIAPDSAIGLDSLGMFHVDKQNWADAQKCFDEAIALDPHDAEAHFGLGLVCAGRGDLRASARKYSDAIRLRPHYFDALNNLGITCMQLGEVDRGISCFQDMLRLKPDSIQAQYNLSRAMRIKQGGAASP
jgi:tetratricopeptide (TPR) repeat protein